MKFVCPSCKAKYQIADEKILGRTLKMDCRRCNTPITIRGDLPAAADVEQVAEARPASVRPPTASAGNAARRPGAASGGSSVGPHPSRPRAHQPPGAAASSLAPATGSALGADFRKQSIAPSEPRPSVLDQWHVAINDVPVGPMRREEVSRKIAAGAVNAESLAWREGFDDWRPVRDIPELAALLRRAEPPASPPRGGIPAPRVGARLPAAQPAAASSRLGARPAPAAAAPAARGNVVPIGGRLGGAAPMLDEEEESAEEPTQIASAAELGLLAFGDAGALKEEPKAKAPERRDPTGKPAAPARKPEPAKPAARPFEAKAPAPIEAPKPAPKEEPKRASFAPPPPADDGLPPLLDSSPAFAAAPAPIAPTPMTPMAPTPIAPAAVAAPVDDRPQRRGLPVGAWIAIAGAVAFGGVFAVIAAQRFLPPAPAAPTATATIAPATPEVAPAAPVVPEVAPTTETPAPVPETPPAGEAEAPPTPSHPATGGTHHRTGGGTTTSTGTEAPAAATGGTRTTNPDFARFSDDSSGGPATIEGGATARRLGGASEESGSRHELSEDEIRSVVTRERSGLTRCWETAIRGMRETPTVRLDVGITIGSSGAVTSASARGPAVGSLSECIERSVRRWRFPASSGTTETSFPVVFSGTN